MSKLGALVVHGLFEHKGRQQDNVNWLNNLGIEAFSVNLPGHGDIENKGDVASWEENLDVMSEEFQKLEKFDKKIIFAHSYGSLVSVSSILIIGARS